MSNPSSVVRNLLRGLASVNPNGLVAMAEIDTWSAIAQAELHCRGLPILQAMDDDALRAIASGQLDFAALCQEVSAEVARNTAPRP